MCCNYNSHQAILSFFAGKFVTARSQKFYENDLCNKNNALHCV